ncbi:MAG: D-alanyl-D-alanine carboxypeptidase [Oscillospiraceae bacterium]|nr:D-alanyl-D-alanine carboxypeptidase [Oscillospiraceae bacterium]
MKSKIKITTIISIVLTVSLLTAGRLSPIVIQKPEVSAVSAIVMDAASGKVLFSKNSAEIREIASLTKVMTTILTLESGDLDKQFMVDNHAIHVEGTSMGLRENDIVTRRALCYGMMLPSGNDAANAAAVSVAGNLCDFPELMNQKAKQIGMKSSSFKNAHGLDESGHLSTAYDMALLTSYALNNCEFRQIAKSKTIRLQFGNPPYSRSLSNNNKMLWSYDSCIGIKTGFTDNARRCLISAAEKNGTTLVVVTLNAPDDWNDHIKMLEHGFAITEVLKKEYYSRSV